MRVGILGCANIAKQFARDLAPSRKVKIVAVASRTQDSASAFAAAFGIPKAYADYASLLADKSVDTIYLPLPNSMHAEWAVRAARAGKHILCEKPLALDLEQAQTMFDAARDNGVMLLEAYPYYFQPQTGDMLQVIHSGRIGEVRSVHASFGFTLARPDGNIRMNPALGGGALLDAGSYPLSLIRLVMGSAPQQVRADSRLADSGVDISTNATLFWADGRVAQLSCAMNTATHRYATIVGSAGTLETEYLNHTASTDTSSPVGYLTSTMRLRAGVANTVPYETISSPAGSGFRFAAEAFAKVMGAKDFAAIGRAANASLDIAATLQALAQSAKSGHAEVVQGR